MAITRRLGCCLPRWRPSPPSPTGGPAADPAGGRGPPRPHPSALPCPAGAPSADDLSDSSPRVWLPRASLGRTMAPALAATPIAAAAAGPKPSTWSATVAWRRGARRPLERPQQTGTQPERAATGCARTDHVTRRMASREEAKAAAARTEAAVAATTAPVARQSCGKKAQSTSNGVSLGSKTYFARLLCQRTPSRPCLLPTSAHSSAYLSAHPHV